MKSEERKIIWVLEELKSANLADKRRNQRFIKIVEDLSVQPNESIPLAGRDPAAVQAIYEFWANRRIKRQQFCDRIEPI
ncbi:transposase [Aetokthonos hydrillicola Thurmond2011]|uniref:Transposase n=1 Tax=Aetokthonos hydrillicola Thurmond2011 TaxID=2712845 RepID=A0AAP5I4P8_9CYAN|nr:transposase DNA-binding-containing protein [Aetokthonos hydrillicola]MBO3460480.1 hypothetical protein [Aetokthonos hydrillicola CCALA 1050]MBW4588231.1 transposase [Aetokthonos hydrillicola CCALA 1050]MDR9893083.1 transposase [Aetokthonos hydrillicola Thurmond2011]